MKKTYRNKTVYIRESHNEEHPYTVISNYLVKDERLTATEKGIMLMILSNKNEYVFNSSYLQKESGLGKVQFNKAMKRLQELGYLIKKPNKNGGYKWVIMESSLIFEELQKIGYLKRDLEKPSWIIDEDMESSIQVIDFHRKAENRKPRTRKPRNQKPKNRNTDNRIPESQPIISTNEINDPIGRINKEESKDEKSTNERLAEDVSNLGSLSKVEVNPDEKEEHIQNSLPIIIEHHDGLKSIFQSKSINLDDFKLCSDSFIANVFLSIKLEKKDSKWAESLKQIEYDSKHYGVYIYACRGALDIDEETELKTQLLKQSNMSIQELHKVVYGF